MQHKKEEKGRKRKKENKSKDHRSESRGAILGAADDGAKRINIPQFCQQGKNGETRGKRGLTDKLSKTRSSARYNFDVHFLAFDIQCCSKQKRKEKGGELLHQRLKKKM